MVIFISLFHDYFLSKSNIVNFGGAMWPFNYLKRSKTPKKSSKENNENSSAETIIRSFVSYVETSNLQPLEVRDVSKLPYPKEKIVQAFLTAISSNIDYSVREKLKVLALDIPSFQEGVGAVDLTRLPKNFDNLTAQPEKLLFAISQHETISEAYSKFEKIVASEQKNLLKIIEAIEKTE
ncbi:hypothetical protein ACFOLL_07550 [Falsochrobactrum ovis]|nr:hypothetical protein [Falsochrobactrum ovis]